MTEFMVKDTWLFHSVCAKNYIMFKRTLWAVRMVYHYYIYLMWVLEYLIILDSRHFGPCPFKHSKAVSS